MTQRELDNLARIGQLKPEPPAQAELEGLLRSGSRRLADAERADLSLESRFDLTYNAAHALALAALRAEGYRSESRYLVFQCLQHTIDLPNEQWRVLDQAHRKRNLAEYEGDMDVDEQLVEAMLRDPTKPSAAARPQAPGDCPPGHIRWIKKAFPFRG